MREAGVELPIWRLVIRIGEARSQAAAVLGISIRTLRNKLHEYERDGTPIPRPVVIAVS